MILKRFHIIYATALFLFCIFPIFSEGKDKKTNEKGTVDAGASYFSQDEMQFVLGDKEQPWNYGRIMLAPFYSMGIGKFAPIIPYSTGVLLSFDHGIHHAFKPVYRKKSPLIPGLRMEIAYNIFGSTPVSGLSVTGGLIWLFPLAEGRAGDIELSSTVGMNFMRGQIGSGSFNNDALYLTASFGYNLSFSKIFFSLHGRFSYIFDKIDPWMGVGGLFGIGYKFSAAAGAERESGNK
ncbi:MAG: hypothetical protein OEV66_05175 [Spirochaetia bacterium]|nr:hypothetical protein [Spirochaetia bacterium]